VLHALTITDVTAMHVVHQLAEDVVAALVLMFHRGCSGLSRLACTQLCMRLMIQVGWFYSARTRTLETCIRLIAGVELLTWVCQLAVRGDAMLLDRMMK
jgi:hypothetical protein